MKIANFNYNYYPQIRPKFTGTNREYGKIEHSKYMDCYSNDTRMFRNDLDWQNFIKFLQDNFKNKENVNVYSLASSDGSEAYSFLISLFEKLPENERSKFLPVYASDQDSIIINHAKQFKINLNEKELDDISKYTPNQKKYFINPQPPINLGNTNFRLQTHAYEPIYELKKSIQFEQADILQKVLSIKDDGNSVLMCRNVMPYMEECYLDKLICALQNNIKKGSILVLGDFDMLSQAESKLFGTGFVKQMKNVYRKT